MTEYKPLQSLAYEHLREMIYRRELQFGVIYSETRLAAQLNISRTPVRDALNNLNRERYIDILPNRGFQLHTPDGTDIREAYHVRRMIEGYCCENLARSVQSKEAQRTIEKMQECLDHQAALLDRAHDVDLRRFWLEDESFHFAPLHYMNISTFNLQYGTFLHIFMPQTLKSSYWLSRSQSTILEHGNIVQSLRTGDVEKVREAIHTHLKTSVRVLALSNYRKEERQP